MKFRIIFAGIILSAFLSVPVTWAQVQNLTGLTMQDAVSIALRTNRDVINASEEVRRADYRITEATAGAYPQINGSWGIDKNLKPQVFVISMPDSMGVMRQSRLKVGTDYQSSLGATLSQPIYVGGKVGTALKAAKIYKNISTETERDTRQNVMLGTIQAFNNAILAREQRNIAFESLTQAQRHLENVQNLRAAGSATEYDLLRARVNVANQRPTLLEAENNVHISLLRLKEVMGADPDAPIDIKGAFAVPDTTLLQSAEAEIALRNRPDVQASRMTIDLQKQAVNLARGDFLPTLSASTTYAYVGNFDRLAYHSADWNPTWTVGLNLSFPIFTGFKTYAKYKQAAVDYSEAQTTYRKTRDSVVIEVREYVMNLRKAMDQIASQQMNVEEAQRALELSENLYKNGKATQLEVLDAELALAVAKNNMTSALYSGAMAEISLRKSLGLLDTNK